MWLQREECCRQREQELQRGGGGGGVEGGSVSTVAMGYNLQRPLGDDVEMQVRWKKLLLTVPEDSGHVGKKQIWSGSRSGEKGCPAQSLDRFPKERESGQKKQLTG